MGEGRLPILSNMSIVCPLRHSMPASYIFLFSQFIVEKPEPKRHETACLIHKGCKWQSHNLSLDENIAFPQSGEDSPLCFHRWNITSYNPRPPLFSPQIWSSSSQICIMSFCRFDLANLHLVNFDLLFQPLRILYSYRFWVHLLMWGVCLIYLKLAIKKKKKRC